MARSGEVRLQFGAEERPFRLRIGEIRAIEERCGCGIPQIITALHPLVAALRFQPPLEFPQIVARGLLGSWRVDYIREPIYRGLIGGESVTPSEAGALVGELVDGRSPLEGAVLAYEVLAAWLAGFEEEPLPAGEPQAAPKKRRSRTAGPDGPASTHAAG